MEEEAPEEVPANSQHDSQHCLWVDEFAPQHYTELLSDDVRLCLAQVCLASLLPRGGNSGSSQTTSAYRAVGGESRALVCIAEFYVGK